MISIWKRAEKNKKVNPIKIVGEDDIEAKKETPAPKKEEKEYSIPYLVSNTFKK